MIIHPYVIKKVSSDPPVTEGRYRVRFIGLDGKILKTQRVNKGENATPPEAPAEAHLVFDTWNYPYTNITQDTDIQAIYRTVDNKIYFGLDFVKKWWHYDINFYFKTSGAGTVYLYVGEQLHQLTAAQGGTQTFTFSPMETGYYDCVLWSEDTDITSVGFSEYGGESFILVFDEDYMVFDILSPTYLYLSDTVDEIVIETQLMALDSLKTLVLPPNIVVLSARLTMENLALVVPNQINDRPYRPVKFDLATITYPYGQQKAENFKDAHFLEQITLPDTVEEIAASAFENCYKLDTVTLPKNITTIGSRAFANCYGVRKYILFCDTVPTLTSTDAFANIVSRQKIYVKDSLLNDYKTATNWVTFAGIIHPLSDIGEE